MSAIGFDWEEKSIKPSEAEGSVIGSEELFGLMGREEKSLLALAEAKGKEVILLLGLTGSGKSTLTNYLLGCEFKEGLSEAGDSILVPTEREKVWASMGNGVDSETVIPGLFPLTPEISLLDCSGFLQNRGDAYEVLANMSTHLVIQQAARLKIVLIIDWPSIGEKATGFRELVRSVSNFFKDHEGQLPPCLFLINKLPDKFKKVYFSKKVQELIEDRNRQLEVESEKNTSDEEKLKNGTSLFSDLRFLNWIKQSEFLETVDPLRPDDRHRILTQLARLSTIDSRYFHKVDQGMQKDFSDLVFSRSSKCLQLIEEKNHSERELKPYQGEKEFLKKVEEALDKKENDVLAVYESRLQVSYQKLKELEQEIADLIAYRKSLDYEINSINRDDPVLYETIRKEKASEREVIFAFGSIAGGLLSLSSGISFFASSAVIGTLVASGTLTLGGAALGVLSAIPLAYYKRKKDPIKIVYRGVPFLSVEHDFCSPQDEKSLRVLVDKPEEGYYEAELQSSIFNYSGFETRIFVKRKDIPSNKDRIESILQEKKQCDRLICERKYCFEEKTKEKDSFVEEISSIERAVKKGKFAPQVYAEKLQSLKENNHQLLKKCEAEIENLEKSIGEIDATLISKKGFMALMDLFSVLIEMSLHNGYRNFLDAYRRLKESQEPDLRSGQGFTLEKRKETEEEKKATEFVTEKAIVSGQIGKVCSPLPASELLTRAELKSSVIATSTGDTATDEFTEAVNPCELNS